MTVGTAEPSVDWKKNSTRSEPLIVSQLESTSYFERQAHWLLSRFPDAKLIDVPGLVKLVDRKDIEGADWSLTPGRYTGVEVPVPPRNVQDAVARALTTYDSLIDNNRRRMALLEESARLLYREWFVRLRFPGHEHTRITDGVPEGWEPKKLIELCDSVDYGYTASAENEEIGPKFLRIKDIVPDVIDWVSVPFCQIKDDRFQKFALRAGDIVIARTGATVGYAKWSGGCPPPATVGPRSARRAFDQHPCGVYLRSCVFR